MKELQTSLLEKADSPKEFFSELRDIRAKERKAKSKNLARLIVKLNREEGIDFCQIAVGAMEKGFSSFEVAYILERVLADLDLDVDSVLHFAERFFEAMQNDMAAYMQFRPFEGLAAKQPAFARKLLAALMDEDKRYVVGYISKLYQGLAEDSPAKVHKKLCALKGHNSVYARMAVADALGGLAYGRAENKPLLGKTLALLKSMETDCEQVRRITVFAYAALLKYTAKAKRRLSALSKDKSPLIQGAIAGALLQARDKNGKEKWFEDSLLNLADVSCEYGGTIQTIDAVLRPIIKEDQNWGLFERFLTAWLDRSDFSPVKAELSKLFGSAFSVMSQRREEVERLITKFLNHDKGVFHRAADAIVGYFALHRLGPLCLSRDALKSMSYEDCLYSLRKILGYITAPAELCALCYSFLDAFPRNKEIQDLTYSVFKDFIGANYPGHTIKLLKQRSKKTRSKNKKLVNGEVIKAIEHYLAQRDRLANLKELAVPAGRSQKVRITTSKVMQEAMEQAEEGAVLLMIAQRIPLKQGKGWFRFEGGRYGQTAKLAQHSTSMEVPRSEISHPVDAALERTNFRLAKRGAE